MSASALFRVIPQAQSSSEAIVGRSTRVYPDGRYDRPLPRPNEFSLAVAEVPIQTKARTADRLGVRESLTFRHGEGGLVDVPVDTAWGSTAS